MKHIGIRLSQVITVLTLVAGSLLMPSLASAQGLKGQVCEAAGTALVTNCSSGSNNETAANERSGSVARSIVSILSLIVGAVSVIMIIIGGLRYIISGGDSAGLQGAKNTIIYAVVGLVVVLFAQVIVRFVLRTVN